MNGMKLMFMLMIASLLVAGLWDAVPIIKDSIHKVLNPSLGQALSWNVNFGMILITGFIIFISTLLQKYVTDQKLLKQIKDEQKIVKDELKLYKNNPEKSMELSKKSIELMMKSMPITMRPVAYTIVPFILLIRWLGDYFAENNSKVLGVFSGIWGYIILSIVWSIVWRKVLKVH